MNRNTYKQNNIILFIQRNIMQINEKLQVMSLKFKELKGAEFPLVKMMLIDQLKKLAHELQAMMRFNECSQNTKRRRHIEDVMQKCKQIQKTLGKQMENDIGNYRRYNNNENTQTIDQRHMNLSQIAVRDIIIKELRESQLNITNEELNSIVIQIEQNADVMKEIHEMVIQQGQKLDMVEEYTQISLENVKKANVELEEAKVLANKTRMLKIRMAISGVFAGFGHKILGLPGALFGMLFGYKSTS